MPVLVLVSLMLHFLKFLYFLFKSLLMALMHAFINVHLMGLYIYSFAPSGYIMPFYFGFHFYHLLTSNLHKPSRLIPIWALAFWAYPGLFLSSGYPDMTTA